MSEQTSAARPRFVVISGPSGSGKDTVAACLLKRDDSMELAVSATTRPRRGGEAEGVDYYYLTDDDFDRLIAEDGFFEYAQYGRYRYGTLKSDVCGRVSRGKTVLLVIDVQGADSIRRKYPETVSVFLEPPSLEELERRLRGRGTDSEESIVRRLDAAKREMERAGEYTYVVVNDVLDETVEKVYNLIKR